MRRDGRRNKKVARAWAVNWQGQGVLAVAESWWAALLIVGRQFPFDAGRDM
jgi:hypothetical protein